ncbi:hypothetical protein FNF31_07407 [Cafeteria roenbergensis]|uniref:Helicase C-terminal domain-containing protein n=1 Tax=Cafeteria roenbergensis TaxID=33653 RepID=A0A5A8C6S7_CAFRO|nr:hypothetical protein FNF31_07407 [Cafeteria roenbergensis]
MGVAAMASARALRPECRPTFDAAEQVCLIVDYGALGTSGPLQTMPPIQRLSEFVLQVLAGRKLASKQEAAGSDPLPAVLIVGEGGMHLRADDPAGPAALCEALGPEIRILDAPPAAAVGGPRPADECLQRAAKEFIAHLRALDGARRLVVVSGDGRDDIEVEKQELTFAGSVHNAILAGVPVEMVGWPGSVSRAYGAVSAAKGRKVLSLREITDAGGFKVRRFAPPAGLPLDRSADPIPGHAPRPRSWDLDDFRHPVAGGDSSTLPVCRPPPCGSVAWKLQDVVGINSAISEVMAASDESSDEGYTKAHNGRSGITASALANRMGEAGAAALTSTVFAQAIAAAQRWAVSHASEWASVATLPELCAPIEAAGCIQARCLREALPVYALSDTICLSLGLPVFGLAEGPRPHAGPAPVASMIVGATGTGKSTVLPVVLASRTVASCGDALLEGFRVLVAEPQAHHCQLLAQRVRGIWSGTGTGPGGVATEQFGAAGGAGAGPQRQRSSEGACSEGAVSVITGPRSHDIAPEARIAFSSHKDLLGMLVRELREFYDSLDAPDSSAGVAMPLAQFGSVVVDEAHERSLELDLLLGCLAQVLRIRNAAAAVPLRRARCSCTPLRLVICSATMDESVASRFLDSVTQSVRDAIGCVEAGGSLRSALGGWDPLSAAAASGAGHSVSRAGARGAAAASGAGAHYPREDAPSSCGAAAESSTGDAARCNVAGTMFPVADVFVDPRKLLLELADHIAASTGIDQGFADGFSSAAKAVAVAVSAEHTRLGRFESGAILAFLPSPADIEQARAVLELLLVRKAHTVQLFTMQGVHGEEIDIHPRSRKRTIILATSVAESCVTIPDLRVVIDSGEEDVVQYNPSLRVEVPSRQMISRASAMQRRGRCGRTRSGRCIHLYSKAQYETMNSHAVPGVLARDVTQAMATLLAAGIDPAAFHWMTTPPPTHLAHALDALASWGACTFGRGPGEASVVATAKGRLLGLLGLRMPTDAAMVVATGMEAAGAARLSADSAAELEAALAQQLEMHSRIAEAVRECSVPRTPGTGGAGPATSTRAGGSMVVLSEASGQARPLDWLPGEEAQLMAALAKGLTLNVVVRAGHATAGYSLARTACRPSAAAVDAAEAIGGCEVSPGEEFCGGCVVRAGRDTALARAGDAASSYALCTGLAHCNGTTSVGLTMPCTLADLEAASPALVHSLGIGEGGPNAPGQHCVLEYNDIEAAVLRELLGSDGERTRAMEAAIGSGVKVDSGMPFASVAVADLVGEARAIGRDIGAATLRVSAPVASRERVDAAVKALLLQARERLMELRIVVPATSTEQANHLVVGPGATAEKLVAHDCPGVEVTVRAQLHGPRAHPVDWPALVQALRSRLALYEVDAAPRWRISSWVVERPATASSTAIRLLCESVDTAELVTRTINNWELSQSVPPARSVA